MQGEQGYKEQPINPAQAPNITNWKNEPTALKLQDDLEAARPFHDAHVARVRKWNDLSRIEGSVKPKKIEGRSQIQPKLVRRQAEWRYSALTEPFNSSKKLFDVTPVTFEDARAAAQNELVLNHQFRTKINRVKFIDNYVRTNVDEGAAIVRLGWKRTTQEVSEEVPVWEHLEITTQEEAQTLEQAIQLKLDNPREFDERALPELKAAVEYWEETSQPSVARQTGTQTVKTEKVIHNHPTLDILDPNNVYFDPSCGDDLNKSGFVIISFETSQAELKKDKRYKNLKHVNWEGASATIGADGNHSPNSKDTNFNFKDALRKRIVAYEYWGLWDKDGTGELKPIVATWIGNTMIRLEDNPFPDSKPPIVVANYMPIKRELLGEPDAELLEDNQAILGAVTRGMIDLMGRSANAQQGFSKGFLDVVNRRRFESGKDYEFNPTMRPDVAIHEHKYPEIPQSAMLMLNLQNQEAEALTGVKSFAGGVSGSAYGDVAAGIRGALDAASKREMSILRRLADGLVLIGKKVTAMNAVFLSEIEVVRITNEEFVTVKREDLAGDFDLQVDISTAEIDNAKSQDLGFMLQTLGPKADPAFTKIILTEIAKLKRMPELAKKIETYRPEPDPIQQQLAQLEVMAKQKEIERIDSEILLNKARAQRETVIADKTDLDTIEQETGTKHARAVELAGAQGASNRDYEVTKALLKPRKKADGSETEPDVEAAVGFNNLAKVANDPRSKNPVIPPAQPEMVDPGMMPPVTITQ